jgi:hypothetical protein
MTVCRQICLRVLQLRTRKTSFAKPHPRLISLATKKKVIVNDFVKLYRSSGEEEKELNTF